MNLTIKSVDYHRNGICGEPFRVVKFYYPECSAHLVGIVFETSLHVAVIDPINPDSKWRGDNFEDDLRAAIAEYDAQ